MLSRVDDVVVRSRGHPALTPVEDTEAAIDADGIDVYVATLPYGALISCTQLRRSPGESCGVRECTLLDAATLCVVLNYWTRDPVE